MTCPHCGVTSASDHDYCEWCGTRMETPEGVE